MPIFISLVKTDWVHIHRQQIIFFWSRTGFSVCVCVLWSTQFILAVDEMMMPYTHISRMCNVYISLAHFLSLIRYSLPLISLKQFWVGNVLGFFVLSAFVHHQNINEIDHLKHCGLIPLYLLSFSTRSNVYNVDVMLIEFKLAMCYCYCYWCWCHHCCCCCCCVYWNELTDGTAFHRKKKKLKSNEQQIDESVNRYQSFALNKQCFWLYPLYWHSFICSCDWPYKTRN